MKLYKLKKIVEKFENGEKVRGLHVPLYIMQETIRAYYVLSSGRPYEFITHDMKNIFDKCGIVAKPKGIGWIVEKKKERGENETLLKCYSRRIRSKSIQN